MKGKDWLLIALGLLVSVLLLVALLQVIDNAERDGKIAILDQQNKALISTNTSLKAKEKILDQQALDLAKAIVERDKVADEKLKQSALTLAAKNSTLSALQAKVKELESKPLPNPPANLAECVGELQRITDIAHLQNEELIIWSTKEQIWAGDKVILEGQLKDRDTQLALSKEQLTIKNARVVTLENQVAVLTQKANIAVGKKSLWQSLLPRPQLTVGLCASVDATLKPCVAAGFGWRF